MGRMRLLLISLQLILLLAVMGFTYVGSRLIAPVNHPIALSATDLPVLEVKFDGVSGWYLAGKRRQSCVILMHSLRSDRLSMLARTQFLFAQGYSLLLFDFQAHGATPGTQISFGYRESWDALAAVRFMRREQGCQKLGVIGVSMGAAASLLGEGPLKVDALVLESLYSDIRVAIRNRLNVRLGILGDWLEPLLSYQIPLRLDLSLQQLQPLSAIKALRAPLLLIHGSADRYSLIEEAQQLFANAPEPKRFWSVIGAGHQDLYQYRPQEYQTKVLEFFNRYLLP